MGSKGNKKAADVARGTTIKKWYDKGKACDEYNGDDFSPYRVWKTYKEYLSRVPKKPLRGPPKNKWTAAEVEDSSDNEDFSF